MITDSSSASSNANARIVHRLLHIILINSSTASHFVQGQQDREAGCKEMSNQQVKLPWAPARQAAAAAVSHATAAGVLSTSLEACILQQPNQIAQHSTAQPAAEASLNGHTSGSCTMSDMSNGQAVQQPPHQQLISRRKLQWNKGVLLSG